VVDICAEHGRPVASWKDARRILNMPLKKTAA
jgi:hypothetical protein